MEEISLIYYKACSSFVKILPSEMLRIYELTKFEDDAFKMKGEINYRSLQVNELKPITQRFNSLF